MTNLADETRITQEELTQCGELAAILADKYALAARWAPEVGLVIVLSGYAARMHYATKDLEDKAQKRKDNNAKK